MALPNRSFAVLVAMIGALAVAPVFAADTDTELSRLVAPTISPCISQVTGANPDVSPLLQAGFTLEPKMFGPIMYTRKLGARTIDRLNLRDMSVSFSARHHTCSILLGPANGYTGDLEAVAREEMVRRGFKPVSRLDHGRSVRYSDEKTQVIVTTGMERNPGFVGLQLNMRPAK